MRPILLKLQAFGPYPVAVTIDFRDALERRLFGIYGPMGAGKSSIFNAMCFALFGKPVRADVDPNALRSQLADPEVATRVEFVFEARGKQYRIMRQLEHIRPKRKGKGVTSDDKKAHLFDVTGLDPLALDDRTTGTVLAEGKIAEVTDAIVKLLGYGYPQFRQIVLLPQGDFARFLAADSTTKTEILKDLFDVSIYRRLREHFHEAYLKAQREISDGDRLVEQRLATEGFTTLQDLVEAIESTNSMLLTLDTDIADKQAAATSAQEVFRTAAATKQVFAALFKARDAHEVLVAKGPAMETVKSQLAGARKVQAVLPLHIRVATETKALDAAKAASAKATAVRDKAKTEANAAGTALAGLDEARATVKRLDAELQDLNRYTSILATVATKATELATAKAAVLKAVTTAANDEEAAQVARDALDAARARLDVETTRELRRKDLDTVITGLRAEHRNALSYQKTFDDIAKAEAAHTKALAETATAKSLLDTAREEARAAEAALIADHAAFIASHLEAGAPCPVCGSVDHPRTARGDTGDEDVARRHEAAQARLETARRTFQAAEKKDLKTGHDLASRKSVLAESTVPARSEPDIAADLKVATDEVAALGSHVDLVALKAVIATCDETSTAATARAEAAKDKRNAAVTLERLARQAHADALAGVPTHLQPHGALEKAQAKAQKELTVLTATITATEQRDKESREALIRAEAEVLAADANTTAGQDRLKDALNDRDAALAAHALVPEDLVTFGPLVARIDIFAKEVGAYAEELAVAANAVATAEAETREKSYPDLEPLEAASTETAGVFEAARELRANTHSQNELRAKLYKQLDKDMKALRAREAATASMRELGQHMAGLTGQKMTLEAFAIAAMFDTVLDAANQRLKPMVRGRFSLSRGADTKGGGKKGLDIAVYDAHSSSTRAPSTLSGGETFIVALALALGLSDVVQASQGSISLDTLFIDEGFGSLDAENDGGTLARVLASLSDVAGNARAVGVISHVPLVRQYIPDGFEIISAPGGSVIRQIGDTRSAA